MDDNEAENLRQRRFKRKKLKLENSLELLSWKLAPDPGPCSGPGPCPAAVLNANGRVWRGAELVLLGLRLTQYTPDLLKQIISQKTLL